MPEKHTGPKEYSNSENGIKYQLIEEKLLIQNDIQINIDSIKEFATKMIKNQMAAYGQKEPEQKELDSILSRILSKGVARDGNCGKNKEVTNPKYATTSTPIIKK